MQKKILKSRAISATRYSNQVLQDPAVPHCVVFAGYVVKQGPIRASRECAIALKEFPGPQNIHELRSFLGLAQQLARFIPDLPHASEPLHHLLKKEKKYRWSFDLQDAFEA
jgi:hypothetical protein